MKKRTPNQILGAYRSAQKRKPHPHPAWSVMIEIGSEWLKEHPTYNYVATDLGHDRNYLTRCMPEQFLWFVSGGTHIFAVDPTMERAYMRQLFTNLGGYQTFVWNGQRMESFGVLNLSSVDRILNRREQLLTEQADLGKRRWRPLPDPITRAVCETRHATYHGVIVPGSAKPSETRTNEYDQWWHWSYLINWGDWKERRCVTRMTRRFESHGEGRGEHIYVVRD